MCCYCILKHRVCRIVPQALPFADLPDPCLLPVSLCSPLTGMRLIAQVLINTLSLQTAVFTCPQIVSNVCSKSCAEYTLAPDFWWGRQVGGFGWRGGGLVGSCHSLVCGAPLS